VLVVVEDLHWIDPSTSELLSLLIDQVPSARVLVVLTFRPDFTPPWAVSAHMTHISLSRFARRQIEAMVEKVAGSEALSTEVIQQMVEKTDGVPLFVEELTKSVVEAVAVGAHGRAPLPERVSSPLGPCYHIGDCANLVWSDLKWEDIYEALGYAAWTMEERVVPLTEVSAK
jgi:hypothetical protein